MKKILAAVRQWFNIIPVKKAPVCVVKIPTKKEV